MIALIARLPVKPGRMDEAIGMLKSLMVEVANEKGTLAYTLNRGESEPDTLVIIERYTDDAALKLHGQTPHFKDFSGKIGPLLSGKPSISRFEEIHSI